MSFTAPKIQQWMTRLSLRQKVVVSLCAAAGIFLGFRSCSIDSSSPRWVRAVSKPLSLVQTETGILQPTALSPIESLANGSLIQVPEDGIHVKKGDELFLIDEDELTERIESLEEQIADLESDLEVAKREYRAAEKKAQAILKSDQSRLTYAEYEQSFKLVAIQPEDQRLLDINIQIAELDLADAQAEYDRMKKMVQRSFAAASQLDPLERRVDSAKTYYEELKLNLKIQEKGITQEERITLQAEVDQARAAVERSQIKLNAQLKKLETAMDRQRASLRHLREDLAIANEQRKNTVIRAPMDGVIRLRRKLSWSSGSWQPISTGTTTYRKDILADLVSPDVMQIELMIHESNITRLSTGMPVRVRLTAYPDKTFFGNLIQLSNLGQDRSDLAPPGFEVTPSAQAVFRGIVDFDSQNLPIQPGMSAQVHIQSAPTGAMTVLPREAVGYLNRVPHVMVRQGRKIIPVEGRPVTPEWFEITNGLDPDTRVRTPFPSQPGDAP